MSGVISFRLDKDNQCDAAAFQVLQAWIDKGYSTRYILTEALTRLNDSSKEANTKSTLLELSEKLNQIYQYLKRLEKGQSSSPGKQSETSEQLNLSD